MRTTLSILQALLIGIVLGLALHVGMSRLLADARQPGVRVQGAADRLQTSPAPLLRS